MNNSLIKILALVGLTLALVLGYILYKEQIASDITVEPELEVEGFHIHAGFIVYENGELIDFSGDQYMNFSTCGVDEENLTPEEIQLEKGHLHDNDGDVAHVHREGGTWKDLFSSIGFNLVEDPLPVTYLNGQSFPLLLNEEINDMDSAVFIVGESDNVQEMVDSAINADRIQEVASKSESCGI